MAKKTDDELIAESQDLAREIDSLRAKRQKIADELRSRHIVEAGDAVAEGVALDMRAK